jgi:hypothetical protein
MARQRAILEEARAQATREGDGAQPERLAESPGEKALVDAVLKKHTQ